MKKLISSKISKLIFVALLFNACAIPAMHAAEPEELETMKGRLDKAWQRFKQCITKGECSKGEAAAITGAIATLIAIIGGAYIFGYTQRGKKKRKEWFKKKSGGPFTLGKKFVPSEDVYVALKQHIGDDAQKANEFFRNYKSFLKENAVAVKKYLKKFLLEEKENEKACNKSNFDLDVSRFQHACPKVSAEELEQEKIRIRKRFPLGDNESVNFDEEAEKEFETVIDINKADYEENDADKKHLRENISTIINQIGGLVKRSGLESQFEREFKKILQ